MDPTAQLFTLDWSSTDDEKAKLRVKLYGELVECLTYLVTCTQYDITYGVGPLGKSNENSGKNYWQSAKRVVECLQATKDFPLTVGGSSSAPILSVYFDSKYNGDEETWRLTMVVMAFAFGSVV